MAFDFLGTMVRGQWDSLKAFVEASAENRAAMIENLEFSISQQEKFTAKLMYAEGTTGGTSVTGFSGATYLPADREDRLRGEYREREHSQDPELNGLLLFLLERALDRANFIQFDDVELDASQGNFGGGDFPWMDIPQTPQFADPAGAHDDRRTFPLTALLKEYVLPQIEYRREHLEHLLKEALDRREQLLILMYLMNEAESLVARVVKQLKNQFKYADPGLEVDDPEAEPIENEAVGLVEGSDPLSQGQKFKNLWESYPPTRFFPTWPLTPPKERGNLIKQMPEDERFGDPIGQERSENP